MNLTKLLELAGIEQKPLTEMEDRKPKTMTKEAAKDVRKSISLLHDRLVSDEKMSSAEAREFIENIIASAGY